MRVNAVEPGVQLEVENEEQEYTVEEIQDSRVRLLELRYLSKWKGFPYNESGWEPVAHLGNSMEFMEEFHQAKATKSNQVTLEQALQEAAEKKARKNARAEAVHQA
jgi:uncharacterized membrane protein YqiK